LYHGWPTLAQRADGELLLAFSGGRETHVCPFGRGDLICHVRNENPTDDGQTLQSESTDSGLTWSVLHSINLWGLPSHLLRLRNGRLLMSYSYRRTPIGIQARLSEDSGKSWSDPIRITSNGVTGDMGYPSTVEATDGTMITVWYEVLKGSPLAQLRQARWKWLP